MSRQIIIIGGGLSGLSALHALSRKFHAASGVQIRLLEKEPSVGGPIRTIRRDGVQFEAGPNGFLDSKPSVINLAKELGLENDLIASRTEAAIRYISVEDTLHAIPMDPVSFFKFKPLSFRDKVRILSEVFVSRGSAEDETVAEFGTRRLGPNFTKYFLDPMISGIFAGDVKELSLRAAFPRMYELEQTHGSLFKAAWRLSLEKRRLKTSSAAGTASSGKSVLYSFKGGMGHLIETLQQRYAASIATSQGVLSLEPQGRGYAVETADVTYFADDVVLAAPAPAAARILGTVSLELAQLLENIPSAPVAVAGLVYPKDSFTRLPKGFGYLIPSSEGRDILGVLFSSQIFENRAPEGQVLAQVMMGGARHPEIAGKSNDELLRMARSEIGRILKPAREPLDSFLPHGPRALPQYNRKYPAIRRRVTEILPAYPRLYLLGNYLDGVSMNDCVANAKSLVDRIV